MPAANLRDIHTFPELVRYLEDELDWPLQEYGFDELTFEFTPTELGLKEDDAARIKAIHQLRPLATGQPWGIFFVEFENKKLPVVVLRRILSHLVIKKRESANKASAPAWHAEDLMFITAFGEENSLAREIAFAHFHQNPGDLPTLNVLGWDGGDTPLKLAKVADDLRQRLRWPDDESDTQAWRENWRRPFRHRIGHVIQTADLLAEELARLARGIRDKAKRMLAAETERGALTRLYKAFQTALIHDLTPESFADTYAQTITYGLLTAAISRTEMSEGRHGTALIAQNVVDMVPITNPFLKEMLQTFLKAGGRKGGIDFDELGIQDVVELLRGQETDLPAILRDFGNKTRGEDPVIHFYEHFLNAYNKQLKIQRGVFYTPQPVVSYIVRSVHELLQSEFGLADGLADTTTWGEMLKKHPEMKLPPLTDAADEKRTISPDEPFVQILDPATGTATFLVEVIDVIYSTLTAKWTKQSLNEAQRLAAWNDYVPKHLLPRLHAYELMMAPYAIAHMKIGLKLAETGYQFGSNERARVYLTNALEPWQRQLKLPDFEALAHEATAVNEIKRAKRFSIVIGNPPYSGESANKIKCVEQDVKQAYQHIDGVPLKEKGKKNWLLDDYVKFLRLSHRMITSTGYGLIGHIINNAFQDNPTFRGLRRSLLKDFSTTRILDLHGSGKRIDAREEASGDENVFDIQQGVCVLLLNRSVKQTDSATISRGDLWGGREKKYKQLGEAKPTTLIQTPIHPKPDQWYFISLDLTNEAEWSSHENLLGVMPINGNGLISAKDHFAYAFVAAEFERDLATFLNPNLSDKQIASLLHIRDNSMWALHDARLRLRQERSAAKLCQVTYRPFDVRHSLFHRDVIFNLRIPVTQHIIEGKNLVLLTTRMTKGSEWHHCFVTRYVSDCALLSNQTSTNAFIFPLWRKADGGGLFANDVEYEANLSHSFLDRIAKCMEIPETAKTLPADEIFHYIYAVFHSPTYRTRYAEFLKIDYPRLPLPGSHELFRALAELGSELVALHLLESPAVETFITRFEGDGDNSISTKPTYKDGAVWINASQRFSGVPETVWNFHVGGYQVCEKWLKDRKGRTLSADDVAHYQRVVVALNETIRLMDEIDEAIEAHGGWPGAFQGAADSGAAA